MTTKYDCTIQNPFPFEERDIPPSLRDRDDEQ